MRFELVIKWRGRVYALVQEMDGDDGLLDESYKEGKEANDNIIALDFHEKVEVLEVRRQ